MPASTSKVTLDQAIHLEEESISHKRLLHVRSSNKFLTAAEDPSMTDTQPIIVPDLKPAKTMLRTMSVYGQKEKKHEIVERPFTAILQSDNFKFSRNNELREVDGIKKRFNRYEVASGLCRSTSP